MAPADEGRDGPDSGEGDFEGRDLPAGRPAGRGGSGRADCRNRTSAA